MGRSRQRRTTKKIFRFWGYFALAAVIYGWTSKDVSLPFIITGSSLAFLYMLFAAPTWCMAPTRENLPCRNNANGLLMGCAFRSHKWEKLKMLVKRQRWAELMGRFWGNVANRAAAVGAAGTAVSAVMATATFLIK